MPYDPKKHHRRSIRLRGYDYSQPGGYFVTICTQDHACLFGDVTGGQMQLNAAGQMVLAEWTALAERFPTIQLDAFVVMPNHVHGVILIVARPPVGAGLVPARNVPNGIGPIPEIGHPQGVPLRNDPTRLMAAPVFSLADIVRVFKSRTTVAYKQGIERFDGATFCGRLWQRNYFEHIIRNDNDMDRIREYIATNPLRWDCDRENRDATGEDDFDRWLDGFSCRGQRS